MEGVEVRPLERLEDMRGWLVEVLRGEELREREFGQLYLTAAKPGEAKAGHYHREKWEWLLVVRGTAHLRVRDVSEAEEVHRLSEDEPTVVGIAPRIWHRIENAGDEEMVCLIYSDRRYDPENPDSYEEW